MLKPIHVHPDLQAPLFSKVVAPLVSRTLLLMMHNAFACLSFPTCPSSRPKDWVERRWYILFG